MPELLTIKDLTARFKVHKRTVYRWIKAGDFPAPALKKHGTWRWDATEVNKLISGKDGKP